MFLEVAVEERLVGEVEAEGYLLHTVASSAELHLDFLYAAGINDILGRIPCQTFHYGRKIARGDRKAVGIELHLTSIATVLENQDNEFAQQFLLLGGMGYVMVKELPLHFVV